jgi:hypothetical protein
MLPSYHLALIFIKICHGSRLHHGKRSSPCNRIIGHFFNEISSSGIYQMTKTDGNFLKWLELLVSWARVIKIVVIIAVQTLVALDSSCWLLKCHWWQPVFSLILIQSSLSPYNWVWKSKYLVAFSYSIHTVWLKHKFSWAAPTPKKYCYMASW